MFQVFSVALQHDQDVVTARQRAAQIAQSLGFDLSEQTRIATAVSEIVRNAFRYARLGDVAFSVDVDSRPQRLLVRVADRGPGISQLDDVLSGRFRSSTGMGIGIQGARRLMDRFGIESSSHGTTVVLEKFLPPRGPVVTPAQVEEIAQAIAKQRPAGLLEEIQRQNQDLLRALDELQRKQQELAQINRELEDTNRGVVALYAELDEKADHLRRADELKSRFLSNMTHEFRTPVNSIVGLTRLLIEDRHQAGRDPEPELGYIRDAAEQLGELVNDLLDLAKVEAGKTVVRAVEFDVEDLFGTLRGMLRPLLVNQSVALVFEGAEGLPILYTDEGKVSQILRNLISNGLKFTERGEVRVSARMGPADDTILFEVSDTGIGIAPEDVPKIFEEFTQLEHRLQRKHRGTGLGLALSRSLAELLGGALSVTSELGVGSRFSLRLPVHYRPRRTDTFEWIPEPGKIPVLVVEDAADALYLYEKTLAASAFQIYPARTMRDAEHALQNLTPEIVVLDILLGDEEAWDLLIRMKRDARLTTVPVVVVTSLSEREKAAALGADVYLPKPIDRRLLLETLEGVRARRIVRVLVIDDDESTRFLIRQCLATPQFRVLESSSGDDGLALARQEHPDAVVVDLMMPRVDGREVLVRLRSDDAISGLPVLVLSSADLEGDALREVMTRADGVLSKANLSRDALPEAVRAVIGRRRETRERASTPSI